MNNRSFISLILSVSWQLNLEQTEYVRAKKLKTMCSVIGSFNSKLLWMDKTILNLNSGPRAGTLNVGFYNNIIISDS